MKPTFLLAPLGLLLAVLAMTSSTLQGSTEPAVPPVPIRYVLDSNQVLKPETVRALESLVIEHDRLTGEQVMIAIFRESPTEDLRAFSNRIFSEWRVGRGPKNNGALLTAFVQEQEAFLLAGYGIDTLLTETRTNFIAKNVAKRLGTKRPDHTLFVATTEILRILESPLLQSGQLSDATFEPLDGEPDLHPIFWLLSILIGLGFILVLFYFITSAETHYTGKGWFRAKPWQLWKAKGSKNQTSGGTYGHW